MSPAAPRKRTFLRWAFVALVLATLAGGGVGWRAWVRSQEPLAPPEVPLEGVERPVAAAIEVARRKVREQPRSAEAWGFLGKVLVAHSFHAQALVCLAQAEKLDPQNPRWPYLQGMVLRPEQPERALPHLRRAVELCDRQDPDRTTPRLQLAEVLLGLGLYPEAQEQLAVVERKEPGNPRLHYDLGMLAYQRDDLKSAAESLGALGSVPYARQSAAACLAQIYQRQGEPKRAAEYGRLARQLPRDQPWPDDYLRECRELQTAKAALLEQVQALDDADELRAAAGKLAQLLREEGEEDPATRLILATTLARLGQYREAEDQLLLVLRHEPGSVQAHYALGLVRFDQGEQALRQSRRDQALAFFRAAADSLRRALERKPDHADAHFLLGRVQQHLGRPREAIASFRQAVLCRPGWAAAHQHLGEALAEDGLDEEAVRELEQAVQCAGPGDDTPREALERFRAGRKKGG